MALRSKLPRSTRFAALALLTCAGFACDDTATDAREAQLVSVMASADDTVIRARPALAAGKYTRMATGPFQFFRGTVPVFRNDMRSGMSTLAISSFDLDVPLVPSLGDPHPENFGALRASDGSLALEPNDFDAADRAPYLWDVRRLAAGMAVAALESNPEDDGARALAAASRADIVRAAISAYRDGIERAAAGQPPGRITDSTSAIVADLFRRSDRDQAIRRELDELTVLADGRRAFVRGGIDPEDAQSVYADLPAAALAALPAAIERWRTSLAVPLPHEQTALLDAVRVFGSGVSSWPRIRAHLLLRGPTDDPGDDIVLELKELTDSSSSATYGVGIYYDSASERVVRGARSAWARPDAEPFWGWTEFLGFPCQIRLETEGQKGVKVERMADEEGTVESITALGKDLGTIVARVHASGDKGVENARAIWKRIARDPARFVEEQVVIGVAYGDLVVADHARFVRALHLPDGLRLGIPFDPLDTPSPELASLFGSPPPLPPLPGTP